MVAFWICLCALLNCAGWVLSALHALNRTGYAVTLLLAGIGCWLGRRWRGSPAWPRINFRKLRRRFARGLPRAFLVLAAFVLLGGILYAPTNYDALAYRVPRMLNWLAAERWHWVHTGFLAFNTRTCGVEWVSTPLLAFLRTDRFLFLISFFSFLLLPGLAFSVVRRLGVRGKTARVWMWILPTGYGYILQAGGIANDIFGAVFPLAAVDFALRARASGRWRDAALAILAAALMTSAKASNLPLALPVLIALLPGARVLVRRPVVTGLVVLMALLASFLPTAVINWRQCGDWTGQKLERTSLGRGAAWLHILNNSIMIGLENFAPPVFPLASRWNSLVPHIMPAGLAVRLQQTFEPAASRWQLGEMQTEESAGLGLGVSSLAVVSLGAALFRGQNSARRTISCRGGYAGAVMGGVWFAYFYSISIFGLSGVSRYFLPYYVLLLALPLRWVPVELYARRWWRLWVAAVYGLAFLVTIVSQARPLWPAQSLFRQFAPQLERSQLGRRVVTVYDVYARRPQAFAPVVAGLPPGLQLLGMVTRDDPETSMWRPFGARRIVHVLPEDSGGFLRQRGLRYVLAKEERIGEVEPWEDWLQRVDAKVVQTFELRLRAGRAPSRWHLVELVSTGDARENP